MPNRCFSAGCGVQIWCAGSNLFAASFRLLFVALFAVGGVFVCDHLERLSMCVASVGGNEIHIRCCQLCVKSLPLFLSAFKCFLLFGVYDLRSRFFVAILFLDCDCKLCARSCSMLALLLQVFSIFVFNFVLHHSHFVFQMGCGYFWFVCGIDLA